MEDTLPDKPECSVSGCSSGSYVKGLCRRHYQQTWVNGCVLPRTIYEQHEIVCYDNYADVILTNNKAEEVARTKVDLEDVDRIIKHRWYLHSNGYVCGRFGGKGYRLHRFILPIPGVIDHKNRDKTDNRKSNLRPATTAQNNYNSSGNLNASVPFKGVFPIGNRYKAQIGLNGDQTILGYYDSPVDAAEAYNVAAKKLFGEFAYINDTSEARMSELKAIREVNTWLNMVASVAGKIVASGIVDDSTDTFQACASDYRTLNFLLSNLKEST